MTKIYSKGNIRYSITITGMLIYYVEVMNERLCVSDSAAEPAEWVIVMFLTQINVMQTVFYFWVCLKFLYYRVQN